METTEQVKGTAKFDDTSFTKLALSIGETPDPASAHVHRLTMGKPFRRIPYPPARPSSDGPTRQRAWVAATISGTVGNFWRSPRTCFW